MRKPLIAGNWKMHGTCASVDALLQALLSGAAKVSAELAVFPPFVFLARAQQLLTGSPIAWGGQNLAIQASGAFTGEISAGMLREFGCHAVLVGHSERRTLFGETNEVVAHKFQAALQGGLTPVLCVGETQAEREQGLTYTILREQLQTVLSLTGIANLQQAILAYEPVWAIGTGLTASPETAQEVHAKIRSWVAEDNIKVAENLRILYGGSVKPDNARALFEMPDIDGGLIGGASLKPEEFLEIAKACNKL